MDDPHHNDHDDHHEYEDDDHNQHQHTDDDDDERKADFVVQVALFKEALTSRRSGSETILALVEQYPQVTRVPLGGKRQGQERYPLHIACSTRASHVDLVCRMLRAFPEAARIADHCGNLPLHYLLQTRPTVGKLNVTGIHQLLDVYPDGAAQRNIVGEFPLHVACANENAGSDGGDGVLLRLLRLCPHAAQFRHDAIRPWRGLYPLHLICQNPWLFHLHNSHQEAMVFAVGASGANDDKKKNDNSGPLKVLCQVLEAYPKAAGIPAPSTGDYPLHLALKNWLRRQSACRDDTVVADMIRQLVLAYPAAATLELLDTSSGIRFTPLEYVHHRCGAMFRPSRGIMGALLQAAPKALFFQSGKVRHGYSFMDNILLRSGEDAASDLLLLTYGPPTSDDDDDAEDDKAQVDTTSKGAQGVDSSARLSVCPPMHEVCVQWKRWSERILRLVHELYPQEVKRRRHGDDNLPLHVMCQRCDVGDEFLEMSFLLNWELLLRLHGPALYLPDGRGDVPFVALVRAVLERHQNVTVSILYAVLRQNPAVLRTYS